MGSRICCGHDCFRPDGALGLHSGDIFVTDDRRIWVEPDTDRRRRERWGDRVNLRLSGHRLGCGPLRRAADSLCEHGDPGRRRNITGMGNSTGLLLSGFRHWKSNLPRSGADRIRGRGIKMIHQEKGAGHRGDISGRGGRKYPGHPDRIIGHIPLEHRRSLDCFGNHSSRRVGVACSLADRGTAGRPRIGT